MDLLNFCAAGKASTCVFKDKNNITLFSAIVELIPKPISFPNLILFSCWKLERVFKIQGFGIGSLLKSKSFTFVPQMLIEKCYFFGKYLQKVKSIPQIKIVDFHEMLQPSAGENIN